MEFEPCNRGKDDTGYWILDTGFWIKEFYLFNFFLTQSRPPSFRLRETMARQAKDAKKKIKDTASAASSIQNLTSKNISDHLCPILYNLPLTTDNGHWVLADSLPDPGGKVFADQNHAEYGAQDQ